jgi:hypothetical protein
MSESNLYVSFHGGTGAGMWNNIHAYDVGGAKIGKALDKSSLSKHVDLRELRGFEVGPDGDLYVVNAFEEYSQVLRFSGTRSDDGRHEFIEVFAELDTDGNPGLIHPFDIAFSPSGDLYVSSQDTNLVLRYWGPNAKDGTPGKPMPLPGRLAASSGASDLAPGSFVVSARLAGKHNLPVGLQTVRDVLFDLSERLLVVDEGTGGNGRVLRMDQEGNLLEHAGCLPSPTHLIAVPPNGAFYLSCKDDNAVWRSTGGSLDFRQWLQDDHLDAPSGMALDAQGSLFVASRRGNAVYRYRADEVPIFEEVVLEHLKDHPEFLKLVPA